MKFRILSQEPQSGRMLEHIYDNTGNRIETPEGGVPAFKINTDPEGVSSEVNEESDKSYFHPKVRNLRKLKIQLGFKCNFKCRYCNQRAYEKLIPIHAADEPTLDLDGFVEALKENVDSVREILFMGGEPFVYIKTLERLVPKLRGLYPEARFHTITNGSLIDEKVADWCIENRFNLTISHDGPTSSKYRDGIDILEDPKTLAGIRRFLDRNLAEGHGLEAQINVVVTPDNWKLSELSDFFRSRLQRDVRIQFESIAKLTESTVDQVDAFTDESLNGLIVEILRAGFDGRPGNPLGYFQRTANLLVQRLLAKTDLMRMRFSCDNARRDTMSVDLQGNVLACHAYPAFKTGYAKLKDMGSAQCSIPTPWTERKDCRACPFLVSCLGGCPLQNEAAHEISCRNLKIWHMGLFLVAWYQLFGSVVQSIEPITEEGVSE